MRLGPVDPSFAQPRRELAICAVAVIVGVALVIATAIFSGPRATDTSRFLARQMFFSALSLLPIAVVIALRLTSSYVGLQRNAGRAIALGGALALLWIAGSGDLGILLSGPSPDQLRLLLAFASVGLAEEIAYRGVIQPRAVAAFGRWRGTFGTAAFFALLHIPQRLFVGTAAVDLVQQLLIVFVIGMALGVVMRVAGNVFAGALLHTAIDWTGNL